MKNESINVNQVEIQIRDYDNAGDAVIFLHFSGANLLMWQRIVPIFQENYRVVLVDLRGHGKSSRPPTGYHMDEMAGDILGVMDHLGITQAHVIGSSLGAEVGLSMAANHPDRVKSLVCEGALYCEYGPFGIWRGSKQEFKVFVENQLERTRNSPEILFPTLDAYVDNRRNIYKENGLWNEFIEAMVRYGACEVEGGKFTNSWGKRASENYKTHYYHYRFEDYYSRVKCPILMLPEEDLMENEAEKTAMYKLKDLAEQTKIVEIKGWSHPFGWLLAPEEVSQTILKFLSSIEH